VEFWRGLAHPCTTPSWWANHVTKQLPPPKKKEKKKEKKKNQTKTTPTTTIFFFFGFFVFCFVVTIPVIHLK